MYHMQERQLLLSSLFKKKTSIMPLGVFLVYPNKHTASSFTFTKHLFLLLFLNMYTHKFKVFANIV